MSFAVRRRIAPAATALVGRGQDGTLFIDLPFGRLLVCLDSVNPGLVSVGRLKPPQQGHEVSVRTLKARPG